MNKPQTRKFTALFLLQAFQTGIIAPVISLFFLAKGIQINQLAIIMGLLAGTVILLEVPTGVLADLFGRKRTFLLSIFFSSLSIVVFYFSLDIYHIGIGIVLYGISRALSSGSLEALFIDHVLMEDGKEGLVAASARLNIYETAGLAAGAAIGGFLPTLCRNIPFFQTSYDMNLLLRLSATVALGILAQVSVAEIILPREEASGWKMLKNHLRLSAELLKKETKLILLFLSVFSSGFFLFSLETYWQPQFLQILPDESYMWVLGIIAFLYFAAALAGTLISKRIMKSKRISLNILYPVGRLLLAVSLALLAMQAHIPGFIVFFALIYLFLGISNIPENVLMNELIPSRYRASILSFNSFIMQTGALGASFFSARFLIKGQISSLWMMASILSGLACILFVFLLVKKSANRKNRSKEDLTDD